MAVDDSGTPGHRRGAASGRAALLCLLLVLAACATGTAGGAAGRSANTAGGSPSATGEQSLTVYTCVSDTTIQPVLAAFAKHFPRTHVDLFRAPTGQLNARVAADTRTGGLQADVVWACDPLTQQAWVDEGLTGGWVPADAGDIPSRYRTRNYVGVALLYMVAVTRTGVPAPASWSDLSGSAYSGGVAVPDPALAASALGALGWFSADRRYGLDFYRTLKGDGGVQLSTPDDVTTAVAQGRYPAGITTANSAYAAKDAGSPVAVTWPEPGAIAIYGPVALARHTGHADAAKQFISFVASRAGQQVLATSGSYPTLPGVAGPEVPSGAPVVQPDWPAIGKDQAALLTGYQHVFGGG